MKQRLTILDGMRGSAALFVVLMHLFECNFPDLADNPMHHAFLGVDFFFMLSGFVIGYAYDSRWSPSWTIKDFFRVRLIRLHPLVLLGVIIGALGYWFDPFVGNAQQVAGIRLLIGIFLGLLLIPSPALPNRYDETHSLNGPHWTLLQEYLANIVYGIIARKLNRTALIIITALAAVVLMVVAVEVGQIFLGWGASNFWMAPVRTAFPFFMGLLLFRINARIKIPMAYPLLTLLLLLVFMLPVFSNLTFNGVYEALVVIVVFPFIIAAGAGSEIDLYTKKLCDFCGRISYPIYITHYPFIYIYAHWIAERHPSTQKAFLVGAALLVWFIILAYTAVRFYDEPVREWLRARYEKKNEAVRIKKA